MHRYMSKVSQGVWGRAVLELGVYREPGKPQERAAPLNSGIFKQHLSQAPGPGRTSLEEGTACASNRGRRQLSLSRELPMTWSGWALGSDGKSRREEVRASCLHLGESHCGGNQGSGHGVTWRGPRGT